MTRCHCPWPFHGSLSSYPACTPGSAVTTSSNAPSAGSLCYYRCRPAKARLWFSLASRPPPTPAPSRTRGWRRKQLRRLSGLSPSSRPRLVPASRPSSEAPRPSHTSLPLGRSPAPPSVSHPQVESLLPSHEREGALKADRPVPRGPHAGWPSPVPRPPHSAFPAVSHRPPTKASLPCPGSRAPIAPTAIFLNPLPRPASPWHLQSSPAHVVLVPPLGKIRKVLSRPRPPPAMAPPPPAPSAELAAGGVRLRLLLPGHAGRQASGPRGPRQGPWWPPLRHGQWERCVPVAAGAAPGTGHPGLEHPDSSSLPLVR